MLNRYAILGLLLIGLFFMGCGGETSVPNTPDGVVIAVSKELSNNKPGVLWTAMPASYQKDVESIVHNAAAKMDQEIYDKAFVLVNKALGVLKGKKDFILAHPMVQSIGPMMGNPAAGGNVLKDNWDGIIEVLTILASSELKKLDNVKTLDVGKFLGATGGDLMKQFEKLSKLAPDPEMSNFWTKMKGVKVEVLSAEGNKAKLKITTGDGKVQEEEMVKVEEKWLPADMVKDWKTEVEKMKAQVDGMAGDMMTAQKPMVLAQMAGFEAILDQLDKAGTQEEFNTVINQMMMGK